MQTKDRKILIIIFLIFYFLNISNLKAEEFNITAKEIIVDKENEILRGAGSVEVTDSEGRIINADKIIYEKQRKFLIAEGNVKINDFNGSILSTEKATFDKINNIISTYKKSKLVTTEGYILSTKNINYNTTTKLLSSSSDSTIKDNDGNIVQTESFQYNLIDNIFSSVGNIIVKDIKKNKYFFKEFYIDTKNKKMVGSDVDVVLDQESFGINSESDPRFVANDIFISKENSILSKAVFTTCKKRGEKCPPWTLKAKKITHDKAKKTIFYEDAILKVYDIPIFYFPRFFHPDPTVKRQSGFLPPFFTNSTSLGTGFALPYYWVVDDDRDFTFTPKMYNNENPLFLNEYRQAFKYGFLTLDNSYNQEYNHLFGNLDLNLGNDESNNKELKLKIQRTSNNTYFRKHNINTSLVDAEVTDLENTIQYSFSKNNTYLDVSTSVYQNLRENNKSDQYEYIVPNIMYGKTFLTEKIGILNFESQVIHNNYETNKYKTFLTNDLIWTSNSKITKGGFVSTLQGMLKNTNYETKKTGEYKDGKTVNELNAVLANKISLPMKKDGVNYSNVFSPNFMFRYAPGHMRNLSTKDEAFNYTKLYSLNRTSEIEDGLSAVLGFDFKSNKKAEDGKEREKLLISLGQVFNHERNTNMPARSSLDQEMSDVVGEINYNFSEIGNIAYKFSLDNNLNDLNYNDISTELNFGTIKFNLDYLEQQNHVGSQHYVSSGITLNFSKNNKLSFSTKKNFKTESTELYNLAYQYEVDCLTAGLSYRREFYEDTDLQPKNTLMFTINFPFSTINAPVNRD
jgi:LPS-assembly protein